MQAGRILTAILAALTLTVSCWSWPASVLGEEPSPEQEQPVLTLTQAVEKGLKHSSSVKIADYQIESNELLRDKAAASVFYVPADGTYQDDANAYLNLIESDIAWQQSKKSRIVTADKVIKDIYQKYFDVLLAEDALKQAQQNRAQSNHQCQEALARFELGLISKLELNNAQIDYSQKQTLVAESQTDLEQAYIKLNNAIGQSSTERPVLVDDSAFNPLQVDNLQQEITRILNDSPELWLAEKNLEKAELQNLLAPLSGSSLQPNEVQENSLSITKINTSDTKIQIIQNIESNYYKTVQLESQYRQAEQTCQTAQEDLRYKTLQFNLGLIARGDLMAAEIAGDNALRSLNALKHQHILSKMAFEKPWAS
ncbi:MAG TPA: hypothetical protein DER60_14385 [Syntrophomonas sp.]|jgi:outer membrane protein TolC|nr:hypothetical protein [Syntrophomonas sp.]